MHSALLQILGNLQFLHHCLINHREVQENEVSTVARADTSGICSPDSSTFPAQIAFPLLPKHSKRHIRERDAASTREGKDGRAVMTNFSSKIAIIRFDNGLFAIWGICRNSSPTKFQQERISSMKSQTKRSSSVY